MSRVIAMVLATSLIAAPLPTLAQSSESEGIVLQNATGGIWAVASFEIELGIIAAIIAIQESMAGER